MNSPPDVAQIFHLPSTPFVNYSAMNYRVFPLAVLETICYTVYNPVVSEPYMPLPQLFCDTQPCRFRVLYTRHRHIQFPKGAGIISHMITSQQSIPASATTKHLHRR